MDLPYNYFRKNKLGKENDIKLSALSHESLPSCAFVDAFVREELLVRSFSSLHISELLDWKGKTVLFLHHAQVTFN